MNTNITRVEVVELELKKDVQPAKEGTVVEVHAWKEGRSVAHWVYSVSPASLIYSKHANRTKEGFDFFVILLRWTSSSEVAGLSIDPLNNNGVLSNGKPIPRIERHLPIVSPNGLYMGKVVLHQLTSESIQIGSQPPCHSRTQSEQRVTTSLSIDPSSCSLVKQLSTEKSRLENRLNILELELYEREALLGSLTIELKIRQEEAKYLYTTERVKEVTTGLQAENKELREGIERLKKQLQIEKEKAERYCSLSSCNSAKDILEGLSGRLGRLSTSLNSILNGDEQPFGVLGRYHEADSQRDRLVTREIISVERLTSALLRRHKQEQEAHLSLQSHIQQLQENLVRTQHELNQEKELHEATRSRTSQLIEQIRSYTQLVEKKEKEAEEGRQSLVDMERQHRSMRSELQDAKLENERLYIEIENGASRISDLESNNFELAEANRKIRQVFGLQDKSYRTSSCRRNISEEEAIIEEFCQLKEREERVRGERDTYKRELDTLSQQLERLYMNCERSTKVQTGSIVTETKALQSRRTMTALQQDYEETVKIEKKKRVIVEQQLHTLRSRYQKEISRLRKRVTELEQVEKSAVELSNQLGFTLPGSVNATVEENRRRVSFH